MHHDCQDPDCKTSKARWSIQLMRERAAWRFWCFKLWLPFAVDQKVGTKPVQSIDINWCYSRQTGMNSRHSSVHFIPDTTNNELPLFNPVMRFVLKAKLGSVWWNLLCFRCPTRWIEAKVVHHNVGICAVSSVCSFESTALCSTGMFKLPALSSMS